MAETLIPLEEREEERRPSRVEPPRRSGGWVGKLALVLAVVALAVACLALYRTLPPGEDDPQEPGERAESPTISYRDRELPVLEGVAVNSYVSDGFSVNGRGWLTYEQDGKQAAIGIDVSAYQGEIDWQQVADSGVEFAMIRLGYRGYSQGVIMPDKNFEQNLRGALDAGLEVGVYFFSQAVSVWEAEEEAQYVLDAIQGYDVTYPVAFDWEFIAGDTARTDGMGPEAITRCAGAFCDMIREAGYHPVVYFNQDLGYLSYQLDRLTDYTFWLAEYNARPSFFYHFDLWQYTHTASVPGIEGNVDMNLAFREFDEKPQHGEE